MAILEEETFKKFGYHSWNLKQHSMKKVVCKCDTCGRIRILGKDQYKTLCASCVRSGENSSRWIPRIKRKCKYCGKVFETEKYKIRQGRGLFCSIRCKNNFQFGNNKGENSPCWKPKIRRVCNFCGKDFDVYPCVIKVNEGLYCSRSCVAKAQRHRAKPKKTQPELIFESICKKHNLPFRFVGNGSLWIGNANPDFIHKTRKVVCEVFGDYWHSPLVNKNIRPDMTLDYRRKQLKEEGYKLIVLWETDLKREDAEAFVLNLLHKQKVI